MGLAASTWESLRFGKHLNGQDRRFPYSTERAMRAFSTEDTQVASAFQDAVSPAPVDEVGAGYGKNITWRTSAFGATRPGGNFVAAGALIGGVGGKGIAGGLAGLSAMH